ncbi:WecB/TagA/CpsF family glycosyltransferase [uncultured Amnibacterium sp.]|uniref:WecB/TagA/CpsF family glycosyltransferase n=1 Tax=uncultured Amnibacterium sp. TaxID=1631851 RepID=UPI0035CBBA71
MQQVMVSSDLRSRWSSRRQWIGGVPFVASDPDGAARDLVDAAADCGHGQHVHLANAYTVAVAVESPESLATTFVGDGWNLPDGRPISWISKLRGDSPALDQVRGPQLFLDVCAAGVDRGLRHYLLGGAPEVLEQLQKALRDRFPGIDIVGAASPPFRSQSELELVERDRAIAASGAQVVWVGLGTPKQDVEAERLAHSLPVVAVAVGAAFDYAAGTLREAPRWLRTLGLEWAFRLAVEPARLWRRYLFGSARFLYAAVRLGRRES